MNLGNKIAIFLLTNNLFDFLSFLKNLLKNRLIINFAYVYILSSSKSTNPQGLANWQKGMSGRQEGGRAGRLEGRRAGSPKG